MSDWLTKVVKCLGTSGYPSNLKLGQEIDSGMHTPRKIWKPQDSTYFPSYLGKTGKKLENIDKKNDRIKDTTILIIKTQFIVSKHHKIYDIIHIGWFLGILILLVFRIILLYWVNCLKESLLDHRVEFFSSKKYRLILKDVLVFEPY